MTPSPESCAINDARPPRDLELPVDPAFVSRPPQVSLARMMAKCREMRAMFPQGVPTHEERLAAKTDVEFIL